MHAAVSGRGGGRALNGLAAREGGAEGPAAARAALGRPAAVRGITQLVWSAQFHAGNHLINWTKLREVLRQLELIGSIKLPVKL